MQADTESSTLFRKNTAMLATVFLGAFGIQMYALDRPRLIADDSFASELTGRLQGF